MTKVTIERKLRRRRRISSNIVGTDKRPRISLYRSNRYVYAQAIDDVSKTTIASYSTLKMKKNKDYTKGKKVLEAKAVGMELAKILKEKKVLKGVFDRNVYAYKGRVKALAEGLREGGLEV